MKRFKKLFSMVLVAAMVLSMNLTSFAATSQPSENERPVRSVTASVDGLTSITVGSTAASIVQDVNQGGETEKQIYARVQLSDATEYDLRSQTVTINSSQTVSWPGKSATQSGTSYTYTDVDLLNKYYDITVGTKSVRLAAGLKSGNISVSSNDPLAVSALKLANVNTTLTGTNAENEYSGNPYYGTQNWTNVVYQFKAARALPASTTLSAVTGTMTVANGATVSGCASGSGTRYTFDLSGANPSFTVTNNGVSRVYYVSAKVASSGIQVTYAIDLTEVVTDSTYSTQFAKNCTEILNGAEGYFNSVGAANVTKTNKSVSAVITVPTGTNAMQPMLDLTAWATSNGKFTGTTKNESGYLATLDGLGEFSCGHNSGWMYTDDSMGYSPNVTGPGVGAASYTMTNGQKITWYMTTNYFNHF